LAAKTKRIRRRPEDARALILDAAEALMTERGGPAALRLQDVAKKAGVSHPTILHHFGSREGLVRALNLRAFQRLTAMAGEAPDTVKDSRDGVTRTFAAYRDGLAQRMVWLMQSAPAPVAANLGLFEDAVQRFHTVRQKFAKPGMAPDIADSRAVVHLLTIAAFGDALIGARLRQAGAKEDAARGAFEKWLSQLLDMFLHNKAGL
jgi:AcrR family transcriptional regulator